MKKLFYLFAFMIANLSLQSQPTLTNAIVPNIGDNYSYKECDTVGVVYGEAGAGKTWDYSKLVTLTGPNTSYSYQIVAPSEGISSNLFPTASFAYKSEGTFGYYKVNADDIERLGIGYEGGHELLEDTEIFYYFPFSFGNSRSDIFRGEIVQNMDGETVTLQRYGTVETVADGYGTLILPSGTFPNLLRLKTTQKLFDTLGSIIPGGQPMISETETISYTWINNSFKFGLLSISTITSTQTIMGNVYKTVAKNVVIQDATPTQEPTLSKPSITSPTNGAQDLEIPFLIEWTESEIITPGVIKNEVLQDILYYLEASLTPDFSNQQLIYQFAPTSLTSLEFNTELDVPDSPLYLRIKSSYGEIESDWSEIISFTLKAAVEPPVAPTLSMPSDGSTDLSIEKVRFEWSHPENSQNITYQFRIRSDIEYLEFYNGADNFYEMTNLDLGTTYYWSVRADRDMSDTSQWSEEWSFTTEPVVSVANIVYNDNSLQAIPNPVSNKVVLNYTTEIDDFLTMKVFSVDGMIYSVNVLGNIQSGEHSTELDLSKMSNGTYYIVLEGKNINLVRSIIVNR